LYSLAASIKHLPIYPPNRVMLNTLAMINIPLKPVNTNKLKKEKYLANVDG
jgi:hypothetical protein